MASSIRADIALVERGLFESRAKARAAIEAGLVMADGVRVAKASEALAADAQVEASAPHPWVSRGGVKLVHALDVFGFDPAGRLCLDIGASTGGFTQLLLTRGAAHRLRCELHRLGQNPAAGSRTRNARQRACRIDQAAIRGGCRTTQAGRHQRCGPASANLRSYLGAHSIARMASARH